MIAEQRQNEILLRRYLLGQAAEEEQRVVEHSLLANQEYFNRLLRCEEELIDEYACGAIKGADKECFERHFLATPERRESVAFAQAMHRYFASRKRSRDGAGEIFPARPTRINVALMTAVAVLAVASALLLFMTLQLRQQAEQNRTELAKAEQREKTLTEQMARLTGLVQELSQSGAAAHTDKSDLVSLTLAPGLSRADDPSATLSLPANAHRLKLILKTEGERHRSYRAELQNMEGDIVWSNDGIKDRQAGSERVVEFMVPASLITHSDYLVILGSTSISGSFDKLNTYHFSVIKR
jgi:hypothetical protein